MSKKDDLEKRIEETIKREPEQPAVEAEAAPSADVQAEEKPKKTPWAKLLVALASEIPSKEKEVEKRLRANDINTYQDAANNPNVVINILRDVYGADFGRLMEAAKEHDNATNR